MARRLRLHRTTRPKGARRIGASSSRLRSSTSIACGETEAMRIALRVPLGVVLALTGVHAATPTEHPHWSYGGHGGPAEWAAIDPQYATKTNPKHTTPRSYLSR